MATTVQSRKARGRNLQKYVRDKLYAVFPSLEEGDVESTSMGASGVDLKLSPKARKMFPYAIECKNQESLNVWASFKQAEANVTKDTAPLLVFKRNRTDVYCMLKLDDFLKLFVKS
jgi:hypothetical protein